jgi:hypothetical protein
MASKLLIGIGYSGFYLFEPAPKVRKNRVKCSATTEVTPFKTAGSHEPEMPLLRGASQFAEGLMVDEYRAG